MSLLKDQQRESLRSKYSRKREFSTGLLSPNDDEVSSHSSTIGIREQSMTQHMLGLESSNANFESVNLANAYVYNKFRTPPLLTQARIHYKNNILGELDDKFEENCQCCQESPKIPYKLNTPSYKITSHGISIPLYFLARNSILMIYFVLLIHAGYMLYEYFLLYCKHNSLKGGACYKPIHGFFLYDYRMFFIGKNFNKMRPDYLQVFNNCRFISFACLCLLLLVRLYFFSRQQRLSYTIKRERMKRGRGEDSCYFRPRDFTLMVTNVDKSHKGEDIKAFIYNSVEGAQIGVIKINKAFRITKSIKTQFKINEKKKSVKELQYYVIKNEEYLNDPEVKQFLLNKNQASKTKLKMLEKELKKIRSSPEKVSRFTGVAFVSIETIAQKNIILAQTKKSKFYKMLKNSNQMKIFAAPAVEDIQWENVGYSRCERLLGIFSLFLIINLFLAAYCFAFPLLMYFLRMFRNTDNKDFQNPIIRYVFETIVPIFAILIMNPFYFFICKKFSYLCRSLTKSKEVIWTTAFINYANTATLSVTAYILVSLTVQDNKNHPNFIIDVLSWWLFNFFVLLIIIKPMMNLMNPMHMFKLIRRARFSKLLKDSAQKVLVTQEELHKIFDRPESDYGYYLSNLFYLSLAPMILVFFYPPSIIFTIFYVIVHSSIDKFLFLRRLKPPSELSESSVKAVLRFIFYIVDIYLWVRFALYMKQTIDDIKNIRVFGYIEVMFICFNYITIYFYWDRRENGQKVKEKNASLEKMRRRNVTSKDKVSILGTDIEESEEELQRLQLDQYQAVDLNFRTDYDRANPITSTAAWALYKTRLEREELDEV